MTDLRKAAEMALEALSEYTCVVTSGTDPNKWDEVVDGGGPAREAIQALRQALAQPEQKTVAWKVTFFDDNNIPQLLLLPHPVHPKSNLAKRSYKQEPLYTAPPKREWVGLTDEEFDKCDAHETWRSMKNVEDKLKEKNSGSAA